MSDKLIKRIGKGIDSRDGLWGRGIIAYARESVGADIAQERYRAACFGSGAQLLAYGDYFWVADAPCYCERLENGDCDAD